MPDNNKPRLYVGIGASAGGIQACKAMLDAAPDDTGAAFIVVLHLDPTRASHVAEVLQQRTALDVKQARGVTFAPHNALGDPPFSRMDIVSCRNLLIYLKQEAHDRLLKRFHFALDELPDVICRRQANFP